MHLCIQLGWFPKGGAGQQSTMQVDRVREYPPAAATADRTSGGR